MTFQMSPETGSRHCKSGPLTEMTVLVGIALFNVSRSNKKVHSDLHLKTFLKVCC